MPQRGARPRLPLLLTITLLIGLYAWIRYGGAYGHGDTSSFAWVIGRILDSGQLIPEEGVYDNGYGYQALVVYLSALTGLSLGVLQSLGGALLIFWAVVPAWLAYREFTRSDRAASLATLILVVQPEFLFPLLRGTHEKFTRGLMFFLLFLLMRSFRAKNLRSVASLVAAFYLSAYALITLNSLMATSFMVAVGLALVLLWGARRWTRMTYSGLPSSLNRMGMIILSLVAIAFLFTFYAYPPAQKQLRLLQSVGDQLAVTLLQVEEQTFNPYNTVTLGWVSLPIYFLVSLANWLLLAGSSVVWLWRSWRYCSQSEQGELPDLLLWSFYGAFALQSGLSILVDISGAIAGNLQHRMFPSFAMLAAPVVAGWLVTYRRRLSASRCLWLDSALGVVLSALLILGVIKATNEPLLSNYWIFYTAAERQAVSWAEQALADQDLWVGYNDRVATGYQVSEDGRILGLSLRQGWPVSISTRNFLISEATRLYAVRLSLPLPTQVSLGANGFVTYDNGRAQVYHSRPSSPFQR